MAKYIIAIQHTDMNEALENDDFILDVNKEILKINGKKEANTRIEKEAMEDGHECDLYIFKLVKKGKMSVKSKIKWDEEVK